MLDTLKSWQRYAEDYRKQHPVLGMLLLALIGAITGFAVMTIIVGLAIEVAVMIVVCPGLTLISMIIGCLVAVYYHVCLSTIEWLGRQCKATVQPVPVQCC